MGISSALLLVAIAGGLVPISAMLVPRPRRLGRCVLTLALCFATLALGYRLVGRSYPIYLFENIHLGYLVVVVTAPLLLAGWFVIGLVRKELGFSHVGAGAIAAVLVAGGIWGTHIEPNLLETDRLAIATDVAAPIRVGVLADLQNSEIGTLEWKAVEALVAEQPDLVVVPGDLFQGRYEEIERNAADFTAVLRVLVDAVDIVAVVSGDHDVSGQLPQIVADAGALYIDNTITELTIANAPVRLVGVAVHPNEPKRETIAALGEQSDALTILVSHRPGIAYWLPPNSDVDLIIAGHTHGGQVQLPLLSELVWYSDVPPQIANGGLSELRGFPLYVSTGVGLERHGSPQVRFGVRPEVGILDLVPNAAPVWR